MPEEMDAVTEIASRVETLGRDITRARKDVRAAKEELQEREERLRRIQSLFESYREVLDRLRK